MCEGERVVEQGVVHLLRVALYPGVEHVDDLDQFGDEVGVTDVVSRADEHDQQRHKVVHARVRQHAGLVPGGKVNQVILKFCYLQRRILFT